jgi:aspartate 1-decarboxylase
MLRIVCKSKIQRVKVTEKNLTYEGSLTVDGVLLEIADILEGEAVQVININNGTRLVTYAMAGERNSGTICLNGGTARLGETGDELIVISYCLIDTAEAQSYQPKKIFVDANNRPLTPARKSDSSSAPSPHGAC